VLHCPTTAASRLKQSVTDWATKHDSNANCTSRDRFDFAYFAASVASRSQQRNHILTFPQPVHPHPSSTGIDCDISNKLRGACRRAIDAICEVGWREDLVHQQSYEALSQSARRGCGICAVLSDLLHSSEFEQDDDDFPYMLFPLKCRSDTASTSRPNSFDLTITSYGYSIVGNSRLKFTFDTVGNSTVEFIPCFDLSKD
jgi:hypothetical protein